MTRFLLDTNHLSEAIRPVTPLRDRLRKARRAGDVLGVCVPILCELEAGIEQTRDPEAYRTRLRRLSDLIRVWPLEPGIGRIYGEIFIELRRRGRALSQVDIQIAALCRNMNLKLLTADLDFEALPDLRTENWLESSEAK